MNFQELTQAIESLYPFHAIQKENFKIEFSADGTAFYFKGKIYNKVVSMGNETYEQKVVVYIEENRLFEDEYEHIFDNMEEVHDYFAELSSTLAVLANATSNVRTIFTL